LRSFQAIENHELGPGDSRGVDGPLHITISPDHLEISDRFVSAAGLLGVRRVSDLNHPDQEGIAYAPRTIYKGRRESAARAFLRPARGRPNLQIETGVTVERILFEERRTRGVSAVRNGNRVKFETSGEVIVSAGALASPVLLQRSGIGPAAHLKTLGVEVIYDSPRIGQNLLEHRLLMMHYRLNRPLSVNCELLGLRLIKNGLRYVFGQSGPLAAGSYDVGAFIKTRADLDRPDVEILMAPYGYSFDENDQPIVLREHSFHMFGYPLRSRSQGSILIKSADTTIPARIRPNYLSNAYDRDVTVAMFQFMRRLVAQSPLAEVISEEIAPGAAVETDEDIIAAFRTRGHSGYHACGTVSMGGPDAPLDEQLRVRGIDGLRVVDGSVMPTMVSANTNGPIMAIGWRAAELIRQGCNR
ncbi:MAG: hypothetical protein EPO08_04775, partial [Rhodospirillaceae bacterium]